MIISSNQALPVMDSYHFLIPYCLAEDAANSNGNYGPPRTNSGLKPGHRPIYWRNDVVGTEDYGPTGPNPKHQPPPPPLVNTEDYGPTGPNPKHQPQPPPHHPLLSYVKTED
ncbi:hypothetical protein SLE2022_381280 [Rubroshorea leprosula]